MRAMVLAAPGPIEEDRLEPRDLPVPAPGPGQVLIRVLACAVCRTDLHVVEGELPDAKPDVVPGHQIVGTVEAVGDGVEGLDAGQRVGVPWLWDVCGRCRFCLNAEENLCDAPTFTGYTVDGGYAEYVAARDGFVFPIPDEHGDVEAAPLLCAGLIGSRALRLADPRSLSELEPPRVGLYGFGSAARMVAQVARHLGHDLYVHVRSEASSEAATEAREAGARWVGSGDTVAPEELDSAIIFAPAGELVPLALRSVRKGGVVVCAGIHMSPIPQFEYELLWGERVVRSVANLTRRDGVEFLELARRFKIKTATQVFPLEQANEALRLHKAGALGGTAVLVP